MFIKKDLRKIHTIFDEAVDCGVYDASIAGNDENDTSGGNRQSDPKRTKRQEPLRILKLGRRKQEFEGSIKVLCQPSFVPKLNHLEVLNLYECDIHDLEGFGSMFETAAPNLETLNLGRNPLSTIPDDFCKAKSIKHLWLDDCNLRGALPRPLLHMPNMESLRVPNNQITHLGIGGIDANVAKDQSEGEEFEFEFGDNNNKKTPVIPLVHLKILCLDRNMLGGATKENDGAPVKNNKESESENGGESTENMEEDLPKTSGNGEDGPSATFLPSNLAEWAPNLEECFLRHNHLTKLRIRNWPQTLKVLQVSSNQLVGLDEIVGEAFTSLTHLYANGNRLESLPEGILSSHPNLERLVVSHNVPLTSMPQEVWQRLKDNKDESNTEKAVQILWQPNPNLREPGTEENADSVETKSTKMQVC